MKRILIADDHEAVLSGLRSVLEQRSGWEVVAEARNGTEAVAEAIAKQPDVAILDYSMPRMNGVEAAHRIKEQRPLTEILIFTMHGSSNIALLAYSAGARAFLLKSGANTMLLAAVESLMIHRPFYVGVFSSELGAKPTRTARPTGILSPQETAITKLVAEGYSSKCIAAILHISVKTTETHRASAMHKLNIHSVAGLVRYAVRNNLIEA
jgi:DNA-binding NarL/FixJ family response regulator